ncbi:hypothetical protein ASPWEDRAFT_31301 [Aspergillus wentii DTO 134E9]|uniref:Maintenance of telomere capping protein 6 n=1 Tax=Aspergillus wentii DTO 134E9 TaxID=1073089 RepID=A0A1L9RC02_ASPWE|nr:uncharacterized protein ASPWEDRAFT_31301 [Aspergillus wentii DTO 134E9]KAI9934951.1 hypothetical protein MW887_000572 [Aspergillus wentii]OJJ32393.1 hypothetical protein ASPWEDRAFT_31301 [Aspergillus wentii DTO 134E9]
MTGFHPDSSPVDTTWAAVLLSERDVAGQVPINFVTHPVVSLRAACFGNNVFDYNSAVTCISNLLAVGYRRFVVDLYWCPERQLWTFCPVTIPTNADVVTVSSTVSATSTPAPSSTATYDSAESKVTVVSSSSGSNLYELGPYFCSKDLDVSDLVDVFVGYFRETTSQMSVYMEYLIFNLHAAASASTPDEPAKTVTGSWLPKPSDYLSAWLEDPLNMYIYGPAQLADERSNLNNSWYQVENGYKPIAEYFTTIEDSDGKQSTPDGWPCSKYVQLARERRILLGYGTIDSQLDGYDEISDNEVLFPPGYLTHIKNVTIAESGTLGSCLYDPDATQVSQANSSWAESGNIPIPNDLNKTATLWQVTDMISNLTACGLSPTVNDTLFGATADTDSNPYRNVSLSTSWAWAIGEPKRADSHDDQPKMDRCAIMDLSLKGRWRAANCSETNRRVACRVNNKPFTWAISSDMSTYDGAFDICPDDSHFGVPRTGLENTYLYRHALSQSKDIMDPASTDAAMREILLDFNSLDIGSCWVSGSPRASCPYASDPEQLERRTVIVSLIAGIVIFIITALTLFVKCNANRRNSRRRKRVIEGWEYEGVPS